VAEGMPLNSSGIDSGKCPREAVSREAAQAVQELKMPARADAVKLTAGPGWWQAIPRQLPASRPRQFSGFKLLTILILFFR